MIFNVLTNISTCLLCVVPKLRCCTIKMLSWFKLPILLPHQCPWELFFNPAASFHLLHRGNSIHKYRQPNGFSETHPASVGWTAPNLLRSHSSVIHASHAERWGGANWLMWGYFWTSERASWLTVSSVGGSALILGEIYTKPPLHWLGPSDLSNGCVSSAGWHILYRMMQEVQYAHRKRKSLSFTLLLVLILSRMR